MSKVYDDWERLVGAVLKREELRQIALCPSFSSSSSFSSDFHFDPSSQHVSVANRATGATRGGVVARLFAAPAIALDWYRRRKPEKYFFDGPVADDHPEVHLGQLERFSLRELRVASDNFSNKNILCRGGFCKVYKGRLADGSLVAVQRLEERHNQHGELQFQTEMEMISLAVHRNLLRLLDGGILSTEPLWQRTKWTNDMVKLLITAVSYVGQDSFSESPEGERRSRVKGKWKAISKCMIERGYLVSPQQCEDKFNHLNKKYKRLNDIVGSADSRVVVENPALIETVDIRLETKDEVRKILMCKQLFYREMFSYHNRNWNYIPQDESLRLSLLSALRGKIKHVSRNMIQEEIPAVKRQKQGGEDQVAITPPDTRSLGLCQKDHNPATIARLLQLQEMKKQIQDEKMELEKNKFGWLEDRELHQLKLENEILKLENERLMLELKIWEIRTNNN